MDWRFVRTHLVCGRGVDNLWIIAGASLHKAILCILA